MIHTYPKKLYAILCLVAVMLIAAMCFAVYFHGDGAYNGAFQKENYQFSVSQGNLVFLSEEGFAPVPSGEMELCLSNEERENATFILYQNGAELYSASFAPYEKKDVRLSVAEKAPLSIVVLQDQSAVAYLTDSASAKMAALVMKNGGDLVCLSHCDFETLSLFHPFRFFGDFSFDEISVEYSDPKPLVLSPNTPFEAALFVNAPMAHVYYRSFTPNFLDAEKDFYLKAKTCNGKLLEQSSFPIASEENLIRLCDDELLPKLTENSYVSFVREFSVTKEIRFDKAVNLDFQVPVHFENANLRFTAEYACNYTVKTALGSGILCADLVFDAPFASLTWESLGEVPAMASVEKQNNLAFYNGEPLSLGGEGDAVPELILKGEENSFLDKDLIFTVNGNTLEGVFPYDAVKKDLESAAFSLSAQGGSARLEGTLADGSVITTDTNGKERRFALSMKRQGYNIPVVYLETEDGAEITSKKQYINATFSMDGGTSEYTDQKETTIRIRGRGNSSWKWDKKPYKIHFAEPTSLLGLPAAEEWALFSNYADKSLFRNRLAQVMASNLSFDYNPTHVCVDVFLNGEYLGVYTLGEHLEEGEGRVEVEYDMSQRDCGYFMEAGGVVSGVDVKGMNYFHAGLVKFVLVKGPEYNSLTSEQFAYIKDYLTAANAAVIAGEGYEEYLDMETLVDWLIMTELSNNTDCSWRRSTYLVKNPGEKIKFGPVWDFDLAFGNFSKDDKTYESWASTTEDDYVGETWSTHLLKDPEFQKLFKARWLEVKDLLLETALDEINASYELLYPSAMENFKRWDILGKKVAFEPHSTSRYPTFESQMDYLRDFLEARVAWITDQVENW